jgi:hypothetical protein
MHDRAALLAAIDLHALAAELLGPPRNHRWPCPNPDHPQTGRTPPMSMFATRDGEPRWRCHGCGAGGTAIDLVMAVKGVDVRDAIDALAAHHSIRRTARYQPARDRGENLEAFIAECAERLWHRDGACIRRWAMGERHLSEEALRANRVGADVGRRSSTRPTTLAAAGPALVLPTHQHTADRSVQLRLLRPRLTGAKYLSPRGGASGGPRIAVYRGRDRVLATTVVAEGPIDALSAVTVGFNAIAVLGVAAANEHVADYLAERAGRVVLAFDADVAGQTAQHRLEQLLAERGRPATCLALPEGVADLNDWLANLAGPRQLQELVADPSRSVGIQR